MLLRRTATGPSPIGLIEAKEHLRVDSTDEDSVIAMMLESAVAMVGDMAGRALTSETCVLACQSIVGDLVLPKSPVTDVTGISYYNASDVLQTASLSEYYVFSSDDRATVRPKSGVWPSYSTRADAVQVTFTCGYATIPAGLRAAVLLALGDLYAGRGDTEGGKATATIEALVSQHRLDWFAA